MKNKLFIIISLAFGMCLVSLNSFAGQIESTTVQSIQVHSSKMARAAKGLLVYGFADLPTDSPACATDPEGRMIVPHTGIDFGVSIYTSEEYIFRPGTAIERVRSGDLYRSDTRVIDYLKEAYDNDSLLDVVGTGDCFLGFEVVQYIVLKK